MSDVVRWVMICGGTAQLGFNLSLWKHVPRLVPYHQDAWRLFIAGHTALVVFAIDALHSRLGEHLGWPVAAAVVSGLAAVVSFVKLERSLKGRRREVMDDSLVRLVVRAGLVAVTSFLVQLQASESWDGATVRAAAVAAVLAAVEFLTPVNPHVGLNKG